MRPRRASEALHRAVAREVTIAAAARNDADSDEILFHRDELDADSDGNVTELLWTYCGRAVRRGRVCGPRHVRVCLQGPSTIKVGLAASLRERGSPRTLRSAPQSGQA